MRKVILHYHLFKNAGTSFDAILKSNFPEKWTTKEFPSQAALNKAQVLNWIEKQNNMICFSSHTALLPPPILEATKVLPVIFMRHPIDRIASAHAFEKKQDSDGFGAVLARNTSLAGYIETRLALGYDRQCRNFHMHRLADMFPQIQKTEFERAVAAVKTLPFIGIVERFTESLEQLEVWFQREGFKTIQFQAVEKNVSRNLKKPLELKLHDLKTEMGEAVYSKLVEANQEDLKLYQLCQQIFDRHLGSVSSTTILQ